MINVFVDSKESFAVSGKLYQQQTKNLKQCKNIALHGYCRNIDKCEFSHELTPQQQQQQQNTNGNNTSQTSNNPIISPNNNLTSPLKKSPIDNLTTSFQNLGTNQQTNHHWADHFQSGIPEYIPKQQLQQLQQQQLLQQQQQQALLIQQQQQQQNYEDDQHIYPYGDNSVDDYEQHQYEQQPQPNNGIDPNMNNQFQINNFVAAQMRNASPQSYQQQFQPQPQQQQPNTAPQPSQQQQQQQQAVYQLQQQILQHMKQQQVLQQQQQSSQPLAQQIQNPSLQNNNKLLQLQLQLQQHLQQLQIAQQQAQQQVQSYTPYPSYSQPVIRNKPGRRNIGSFFMSESLKQDILNQKSLLYLTLDPNDPRIKNIPPMLNKYHSLYPLDHDASRENQGKMFGYITSVYKAISTLDGLPYAIRRVEGFRLSSEYALQAAETWRNIQHPNIVSLKEIFVSKEFGDNSSLFFTYEFFPGSETLESKYLSQSGSPLSESVLWSFICQITSALKTIHSTGLVCRVIHPSKILLTGKNRIRMNGVGIFDVVNFDTPRNLAQYQHEDLLLFGRLILTLACRSAQSTTTTNLSKSIEYVSNQYSKELYNLIVYLLTKPVINLPNIDEVVLMISGRLLQENNYLHTYTDDLETELSKEYENGRLFRLVTKLGFINERPLYDMDPRWSETGDRYLIKLFRDYIFHQVYDDGTPVLDFYHVVETLNKLDCGVEEKILLMSRDEQSLLVVSYKDLKKCIDSAFSELVSQKSHI
ncbi:hypothetical protein RB653_004333 [Dictyostelium firmibasis]|uniref:PAN2-PAN3 deadenylation complex subunit PAN3 n=1 Tax=Dictyostelium firmibasis TaxID=79012 RepID=A0AAN7U655_9MYCE